jgi:GMP synthase (glutamine-hydrolysing)
MGQCAILIFDFGGQYCHLIARRVRDSGVYSEIVSFDTTPSELSKLGDKLDVKGIILSGGPSSIYEKGSPKMDRGILKSGIPILGICYGHQLIAHYMGGKVKSAEKREFGLSDATIDSAGQIFSGLGKKEQVWMSHGDMVSNLPSGFEVLAHTDNCPIAAFRHREKPIYGIQWHPEAVHTKNGSAMLRNFMFKICGCKPTWKPEDLAVKYIKEIKDTVGEEKAIVALSGGVDSSTAATLTASAIGGNLIAVFVDHGFMRKSEPEQIKDLAKKLGMSLVEIDAKARFLNALAGVADPEEKRKLIGKEFINVFEEVAKASGAKYLVQGTIYPDMIESGKSRNSKIIKSHHNVGGLPERMEFEGLVEPLKDLYKDEVKRLAVQLHLPDEIVHRQPFPGPGLAVRIMGRVDAKKLSVIKEADAIVIEEMEKSGLKDRLWQYFAVLTDTKSTGVKGDARDYGYTVAIRAIESKDAMSATFSRIPYDTLERISTRITNEIPGVVRVVYDITNKPPATIEWE